MNRAEELCHSSGPCKKHKYFKKIGEGANAVYKYARDKAAETGKEIYEKSGMKAQKEVNDAETQAELMKKRAEWDEDWVEDIKDQKKYEHEMATGKPQKRPEKVQVMKDLSGEMVDGDTLVAASKAQAKGARRTADEKRKQYYKTPIGKAEETINKVKKALTPKETTTITDTKTGKTRTPSKPKSQSDTINLKKKKLKHDDLGVAYISHAETQSSVERGQEKINRLFGKRFS